jgi:acyl-CoA thioesterase I
MNYCKVIIKAFIPLIFLFLNVRCSKSHVEPIPNTKKVVVILGSSTAYGTGASPIDSSWVNLLRYSFNNEKKDVTVYNLALGGFTTYNIMPKEIGVVTNRPLYDTSRNVDKALSLKPDFIIISLPSNDIANEYSDQEILHNYSVITSLIKKVNIPFIITSTQPRNLTSSAARMRLQAFNLNLLNLFPENVLNYYDSLTDFPSLNIKRDLDAGDGIHLNNKGHSIIFMEFKKDVRLSSSLNL